jgi:hypothetical protein
MQSSLWMKAPYRIVWVLTGGENDVNAVLFNSQTHTLSDRDSRDATDAAAQHFAAKQLRLSSAANDMDGFVEIERDRDG